MVPIWSRVRSAPRELRLVAWLLAPIAAAWLLTRVSDRFGIARIRSIDEHVLLWFRHPEDLAVPIGPPWVLDAAREITALGSSTVLLFVIFSVAGYLWLERRHGMLAFLLLSTFGGMALTTALKSVFSRARPSVVPHLVAVNSASFPSGHSLLSAVVYLTLGVLLAEVTAGRRARIYFVTLAALLTGLIGLSRVYVGVHYPTDVLGGWMAGLLWALLCGSVARELQRRRLLLIEGSADATDQRVTRSMPMA